LIKSYSPNAGIGRELDIIAAVVIGGGSLKGGRASVLGTLVGSVLMQVIRSGCTQLNVPDPFQHIIIGSIIIAAVLFDRITGRSE
jgi:ribose transport system permease protein